MPDRQPITYADTRLDLPQSAFAKRLAELRIARVFEAANGNDRSVEHLKHRATNSSVKTMIEQEQPHSAPRPNLPFAEDVDAASFHARWEAERRRVAQTNHTTQPKGDTPMSDDTTNRPAETLREGKLKAAIWRNEGENGAYHSVTLARTFKDQEGNLRDTSSFRAKDMLSPSELTRRAHYHTHDLDREAFKEQRRAEAQQSQTQDKGHSR